MGEVFTLQPSPVIPDGHKECPSCRAVKPVADFGKNRALSDGLQFYCRECTRQQIAQWRKDNPDKERANQARYYYQHKDEYRQRRRRWRAARIARLVAMLKAAPCMDCHQVYPSCVMDFDHRPGEEKLFLLKVSKMVTYKLETVLLEIAKCDLVCANCHRMRTQRRIKGE